jgi:hypothetical protein
VIGGGVISVAIRFFIILLWLLVIFVNTNTVERGHLTKVLFAQGTRQKPFWVTISFNVLYPGHTAPYGHVSHFH